MDKMYFELSIDETKPLTRPWIIEERISRKQVMADTFDDLGKQFQSLVTYLFARLPATKEHRKELFQ